MLLSRSRTMLRSRRLLRTTAGLLIAAAVLSAQAPGSGPVPDDVLYWSVFHRIQTQKDFTAHLAAEGKDTRGSSTFLQKDIGLTDAEWAQLQAISDDFIAQEKTYLASRTQLFEAIKADGATPDPVKQAQLQKLEQDNSASRMAHLDQLKQSLGPQTFKVLDDWARKEVLPHTGHKEIRKP